MKIFGSTNPTVLLLVSILMISMHAYQRGYQHPLAAVPQAGTRVLVTLDCVSRSLVAGGVLFTDALGASAPFPGHLAILEFQAKTSHCIDNQ